MLPDSYSGGNLTVANEASNATPTFSDFRDLKLRAIELPELRTNLRKIGTIDPRNHCAAHQTVGSTVMHQRRSVPWIGPMLS